MVKAIKKITIVINNKSRSNGLNITLRLLLVVTEGSKFSQKGFVKT